MPRAKGYKEVTLQQLRSFHETARLGSLSAAADALGLAHPTVWQQVHALERDIGQPLIEAFGRGSKLTDAGRVLAELVAPVVLGAQGIKARFREAWEGRRPLVTVVATPRGCVEDMPPCVAAFNRLHPGVDVTLREAGEAQALTQIEAGEADLGTLSGLPEAASRSVEFEQAYELDVVLVVPPGHPLATKRVVRPEDLRDYPLVSGPPSFANSPLWARIEQATDNRPRPCRGQAQFTATALEFVRLGMGVAVVGRSSLGRSPRGLHERDLTAHFGRSQVYFVRRKGLPVRQEVADFQAVVRDTLAAKAERPRKRVSPKR